MVVLVFYLFLGQIYTHRKTHELANVSWTHARSKPFGFINAHMPSGIRI